jgi:hypothetical protein
MIYFANPSTPAIRAHITAGRLGCINTPRQGNQLHNHIVWCADNGCFNDAQFNENHWFTWLQKHANKASTCVFATAPDVKGDAAATFTRSTPWMPRIRNLGYPTAYVAQDGIQHTAIPWNEFDALFIGGTTAFKLGPQARQISTEARRRGKWLHVGRVSSLKRFRYCDEIIHADSCDGTFLTFGPNKRLPELLGWLDAAHQRPAFDLEIT